MTVRLVRDGERARFVIRFEMVNAMVAVSLDEPAGEGTLYEAYATAGRPARSG